MTPKEFNKNLSAIRAGDKQSLKPIFDEYYGTVLCAALRKTKERKLAEEVAQGVFIYILEDIDRIEEIENPPAWLCQIATNRGIDCWRKEDKYQRLMDNYEVVDNGSEIQQLFAQVMDELTEYQQEIVESHFIIGLNYKEISRKFGRPVGTIKSDMSIIRTKIGSIKKPS